MDSDNIKIEDIKQLVDEGKIEAKETDSNKIYSFFVNPTELSTNQCKYIVTFLQSYNIEFLMLIKHSNRNALQIFSIEKKGIS